MTRDALGNDPFARLGRKPDEAGGGKKKSAKPRKRKTKAKKPAKAKTEKTILSSESSRPARRRRRKSKAGLGMAASRTKAAGAQPAGAAPDRTAVDPDPAQRLEARLAARRSAPRPRPLQPPPPPKPLSRLETLARETGRFLYDHVFRVRAEGASRVPVRGPVMIVANHAGMIPYDVLMLQLSLARRPGGARASRWVPDSLVGGVGLFAALFAGRGPLVTGPAKAAAALAAGEVALTFPEGEAGLLKTVSQRHRLLPFRQRGLFRAALDHGAAVVPAAIVGSEQVHPILFRLPLGGTELPVTPTFPLLGPLGLVPLPARWQIRFGEPLPAAELAGHTADERAESLQDLARRRLTGLLADLLADRKVLLR